VVAGVLDAGGACAAWGNGAAWAAVVPVTAAAAAVISEVFYGAASGSMTRTSTMAVPSRNMSSLAAAV
jgi:hypothetical protein